MLPAIPGRPAAWRSVYCPGILELFHRPAVIREGSSMPVAVRSKAMPTRPYVPKRPQFKWGVAGNSPVYGPGWEFSLVVAQGVAGKPGLFLPGRTVYFCPFQPGVQQDDALRLRQGLGERAGGQESGPAGGAAGPRRLLPGKYPLVSFPGSLIVRSCPEAVNWMLFPACCGGCTNSKS